MYLKVSPLKGLRCFQLKGKLAPRYIGPFKILNRRGEVSYQLELPEEMSAVHNVFHISLLRKCLEVPEKTEVFKNIDHRTIEINDDLTYPEVAIRILEELSEPPEPEASSFSRFSGATTLKKKLHGSEKIISGRSFPVSLNPR